MPGEVAPGMGPGELGPLLMQGPWVGLQSIDHPTGRVLVLVATVVGRGGGHPGQG